MYRASSKHKTCSCVRYARKKAGTQKLDTALNGISTEYLLGILSYAVINISNMSVNEQFKNSWMNGDNSYIDT